MLSGWRKIPMVRLFTGWSNKGHFQKFLKFAIYWPKKFPVSLNNFLILDYDAKGYYRINYDLDNWKRITQVFLTDLQLIPPASRARILDDALILAKIGELPYRIPLEMCEFLRQEDAYMPFLVFSSHMESTKLLLRKMNSKAFEVWDLESWKMFRTILFRC